MSINTHNLRVEFGKHKGELWTRLPVSYLKFLVNSKPLPGSNAREIAMAEMERRGTMTPSIEVSGHAIDRASLPCRKTWHQTARDENEGIHAWLCRVAAEAITQGEPQPGGKIRYLGLLFAFETDGCWPVLKTIMPAKKHFDATEAIHDQGLG